MARRPDLVALWWALLVGAAISIVTPPMTGSDEPQHFTRAYQISTGSILTHRQGSEYGAYLPQSLPTEEARLAEDSYLDRNRTAFLRDLGQGAPHGPTVFVPEQNNASYGPGSYVDYAVAIAFGRLLGLSTLVLLYVARLAGVVTYALLLSLAVRRIPLRPWVLAAVGLIPAALNQASTVSADGMTMVLSFLLVADILRLGLDEGAPRRRIVVELGIVAVLLALAKPPYVALVLLFAVPAWRYRTHLGRSLLAIAMGAVAVAGIWGAYQSSHSLSQNNTNQWLVVPANQYAFHGIRVGAQTEYVLTHPFSFLAAIGRTFAFQGLTFPKQLFGQLSLYQLPWLAVALSLGCLCMACLGPRRRASPPLPRTDRIWLVAVSLVIVLGVFAIGYTNWNEYRAPRIDAVNTRYFLPILPLLLIGLLPSRIRPTRVLNWSGWPHAFMGLSAAVLVGSVVGMERLLYSHPIL
jgi:uncharacterized membrane protein